MASNPTSRQNFVQQAIKYASTFGFDGIDIDWEYPGYTPNGCSPDDPANYVSLLQELRQGLPSGMTLAVATPANTSIMHDMLLAQAAASVDYVNVMAYDYYGSWSTVSGPNSPLLGLMTPHDNWNVEDTIDAYVQAGIPASKISLGFGLYGHNFLSLTQGAPSTGAGPAGPYTQAAGTLSYYEIEAVGGTTQFSNATQTPFTVYQQNGQSVVVGYDDPQSILLKVRFIQSKGLAGSMAWALDLDDFNSGYPLLSAIAAAQGN